MSTFVLRKGIFKIALVSLPVFIVFSFLYVNFQLMESHYNVKKGGLMWFMTMDDLVITDFPIIENTNAPHYDWVGSDSPSINGGRQLSYNSLADENELETVIIKYLNDNKFTLEKTKEPNCNWSNYREDEIGIRYTGVNDKGECLDLIIRINKLNVVRVEVSIII